jgi:RNA polymerase sigma-70 factor, ECF subfamily
MSVPEPIFGDARRRIPYAELPRLSDEQLVEEVQAGNADGFAVIFKRYHRLVHTTAVKILRDTAEAEDVTQSVFLEIYRGLGQFDPARGILKVWLLQFAYSRSVSRRNYLLVRQFHNQVPLSEIEEGMHFWSPTALQTQERKHLTQEVLGALPEAQRRTIEMYFFEGLSLREIAQRRKENYPNVRHHYYRGLERLRIRLSEGGQPPVAGPSIVPSGEV